LINDFELVGDVGGRCAQRRFQVVPFVFQRNKLCVAHAAAATVDRASAKTNKTHFPSQPNFRPAPDWCVTESPFRFSLASKSSVQLQTHIANAESTKRVDSRSCAHHRASPSHCYPPTENNFVTDLYHHVCVFAQLWVTLIKFGGCRATHLITSLSHVCFI